MILLAEKKTFFNMSLIFLVSFLDYLTFSAIIPFIPLFFLDSGSLFFPDISLKMRYVFLGLLYATYPLAQVISAPILGKFSDKFGRKKVLLIAYLGNALGYLVSALSLVFGSIIPLFIGNAIAGLTGANISTVNAIISDHSRDKKRSQYFGVSHLLLGLGFALGPYLSGKLFALFANPLQLCFLLLLLCALVSLLNFLAVYGFLTNDPQSSTMPKKSFVGVRFKEIFSYRREIKIVLSTLFLIVFGWYYFIKIFQVFLLQEIKIPESAVFNILSYYGLCSLLSQALFVFKLHAFVKSKNFILFFASLLSISLFALSFSRTVLSLWVIVALFSFAYSMLIPALTFFMAELSQSDKYGKMMGFHQSIMALAKIVAPVLAACTLVIHPSVSILLSSVFVFLGGVVFSFYKTAPEPLTE